LWQHLYKWARRRHPKKGRRWVTARYFGQYHPTRNNRWVFGDRNSGAYLHHYAVRHEALLFRMEVRDLRGLAVVAVG